MRKLNAHSLADLIKMGLSLRVSALVEA